MAVNLASQFQKGTSDLIKARRKTEGMTNQDYTWDGVNAIIVTTLTDPTIGNYDPNGSANRYGNPSEVEDTQQTWTLTRDRAWTKTIDKKNFQDAMGNRRPGKYLAQVTKNKMVPEIDTYILQTIVTAAIASGYDRDDIVADAATSSSNAYSNFLTINASITDNEFSTEGRVAGMTAAYYNFLKQGGFVLDSESSQKARGTGNLGKVDDVDVTIIPSGRMPSSSGAIDLLITHPSVTVAPEKLIDYTLHENPPGISGQLLEYRHRYEAFCDTNRLMGVGLHAVA